MAGDRRSREAGGNAAGTSRGEQVFERLSRTWTPYTVAGRGSTLFHQGQPVTQVYFVLSGRLKLVEALSSGEEVILDVLGAPPFYGETEIREGATHLYSAITLTERTEVASIDWPALTALAAERPEILLWMLQCQSDRLERAYTVLAQRRYPLNRRLPVLLHRLIEGGLPEPDESVPLPLTTAELAQFVQSSQEALSRTLRALEETHAVWHAGRQIMVRPEALKAAITRI